VWPVFNPSRVNWFSFVSTDLGDSFEEQAVMALLSADMTEDLDDLN